MLKIILTYLFFLTYFNSFSQTLETYYLGFHKQVGYFSVKILQDSAGCVVVTPKKLKTYFPLSALGLCDKNKKAIDCQAIKEVEYLIIDEVNSKTYIKLDKLD